MTLDLGDMTPDEAVAFITRLREGPPLDPVDVPLLRSLQADAPPAPGIVHRWLDDGDTVEATGGAEHEDHP